MLHRNWVINLWCDGWQAGQIACSRNLSLCSCCNNGDLWSPAVSSLTAFIKPFIFLLLLWQKATRQMSVYILLLLNMIWVNTRKKSFLMTFLNLDVPNSHSLPSPCRTDYQPVDNFKDIEICWFYVDNIKVISVS